MSSAEHNSSTNESALAKDPVGVLRTTDTGPMYKYVMRQTFLGTALGTAVSGGLVWALKRYSPAFTRYTNTSARTTLVFAGTGIGFTLSSDWALVRYYRYHDRPEVSGHSKRLSESEKTELLRHAQLNKWQMIKEWASEHRFSLIGYAWLGTMAAIAYREFQNPYLNTVHKIGHARIAAQFVTIAAIFAVFATDEVKGIFGTHYSKDGADVREKEAEAKMHNK